MSAPLFAIVVEILAIKLRESSTVKGIEISEKMFKVSQYCDDTTLFVADAQSADNAIEIVKQFGKISGLELNMDKCNFMWLGKEKLCENQICGRTPVKIVKILGANFSATEDCSRANLETAKNKIKRVMDQWYQRDLTLKGKITVVKSLIASQLVYLMGAIKIENKELAVIQSHIMRFVWRGRPPKVAKRTLSMSAERGGLKVPDLIAMNRSHRVIWISRMLKLQDATFVQVLQKRVHAELKDIVQSSYDLTRVSKWSIPEYYQEMFAWFKELGFIQEPKTAKEDRRRLMWQNSDIRVQGKSVLNKSLNGSGIRLVDDFLDENGNVLGYDKFIEKHSVHRINRLVYMGWCRAIPVQWIRISE